MLCTDSLSTSTSVGPSSKNVIFPRCASFDASLARLCRNAKKKKGRRTEKQNVGICKARKKGEKVRTRERQLHTLLIPSLGEHQLRVWEALQRCAWQQVDQ
jgi:hypothetical protein